MEVIQSNVELDVNSNVFKEGGYWSQRESSHGHRHGHRHGQSGSGKSSNSSMDVNRGGINMDLDVYDMESPELSATIRAVALRLEGSLRAAKKEHLSCGEVLLPPDLLSRVSRDIIRMAETEPCGLRGCLILLNFASGNSHHSSNLRKDHSHSSSNSSLNSTSSSGSVDKIIHSGMNNILGGLGTTRNIGKVRCDSQTVTTFELHLTLREDPAPWYSRLPQFLRNLTKGGTVVVSPVYILAKKKLYRSH